MDNFSAAIAGVQAAELKEKLSQVTSELDKAKDALRANFPKSVPAFIKSLTKGKAELASVVAAARKADGADPKALEGDIAKLKPLVAMIDTLAKECQPFATGTAKKAIRTK